jgi:predicted transcriptional regulator of viral defense system
MNNIHRQIRDRIRQGGRGKVFTPKDFLDIGSREATDKALSRLARVGVIQRLGRGLYHFPRKNLRLGMPLAPDADAIADALARQTGTRIAPSGATAANQLGLSTQVPAKPVYLTDGRSRRVRVGNIDFVVKHVAPKDFPVGSRTSATVFQALRHLGKDAVNPQVISRIRRTLPAKDRARLVHDSRYTTDWIAETARLIANSKAEAAVNG